MSKKRKPQPLPSVQVWLDSRGRITSLQRTSGVEVIITRPDESVTDLTTQTNVPPSGSTRTTRSLGSGRSRPAPP